ncbi:transferase family-domain-containing protein [Xylogone sp. PMI_703]|nr:transferase family-domain-containing protein [Xylogone sp. PMI_703]
MSQSNHDGSCMLSPIDQLMPRIYSTVFLVYETDDFANAISKLNEGLAKATSLLPFLRGSVHKSLDGHHPRNQLSLSWTSQDLPPAVIETPTPESLPSFERLKLEEAPLSTFHDGLSPVPTLINHQGPEDKAPALVIGATRLEGGLILCLCAHHVVMDGAGMGMFLRLLGDCIRNEPNRADDSGLFHPGELYHREAWLKEASGYFTLPQYTLEELRLRHPEYSLRSLNSDSPSVSPNIPNHPVSCAAKIFAFSNAKLQEAKQAMSNSVLTKFLTVNNILGAALWISITRIRLQRMRREGFPSVASSATSKLGFAINARSRVGPTVSNNSFLGNVTMLKVVEFSATKLEDIAGNVKASPAAADLSSIAPVISAIAAAASTVTATHVSEIVSFAEHLADVEDVGPGWNATHGLDLTYTSWANLGMYDCDFGPGLGGKPRFVRIPYMPYLDGMVLALPRRGLADASDGKALERVEVAVMLNEQDMRALEEDELLQSWSA